MNFKVGDKVIFRVRGTGKPWIAVVTKFNDNRLNFKYELYFPEKSDIIGVATSSELTPWTELNEALC